MKKSYIILSVLLTVIFLFTMAVPSHSQWWKRSRSKSTRQPIQRQQQPIQQQKQSIQQQKKPQAIQLDLSTKEAIKNAGILTSSELNSIVSKVFSGAKFHANACGGSYKHRKSSISIPNAYQNSQALARLSYKLSSGEKKKSNHRRGRASRTKWKTAKLKHMRACIDNWNTFQWEGSIVKGKFLIKLPLGRKYIATRGLFETKRMKAVKKWREARARQWVPDYSFTNLSLNVYLTPKFENGKISYGYVDVLWHNDGINFGNHKMFNKLQLVRQKIPDYTNYNLEILRQRVLTAFNNATVRNRLSTAITDDVKSNPHVNQITSLSGGGSSLTLGIK